MFLNKGIDSNINDSDLFRLVQGGNRRAFTLVYEKYHKMLYVLAYRYLKDRDMAEDAVQHVFIKLWEFHQDLVVSISLRNYLYTMTRNYILNQIRNYNSAIAHNYQLVQSTDNYEDNLLETIEKKELISAFYQAIDLLPEQKKIVCQLKMEDKLTNQEIADKMNLSISTIKTHYAQALKILRIHLDKLIILVISIILLGK